MKLCIVVILYLYSCFSFPCSSTPLTPPAPPWHYWNPYWILRPIPNVLPFPISPPSTSTPITSNAHFFKTLNWSWPAPPPEPELASVPALVPAMPGCSWPSEQQINAVVVSWNTFYLQDWWSVYVILSYASLLLLGGIYSSPLGLHLGGVLTHGWATIIYRV